MTISGASDLPGDIIIDCDVGIDDALAIMLALGSKELRIRAITTVCGNAEVEKTSENPSRYFRHSAREASQSLGVMLGLSSVNSTLQDMFTDRTA